MEKMRHLIDFLLSLPSDFWVAMFWLCFGAFYFFLLFYLLFIGPAIYRFWIIPRIRNRYNGVKLVFSNPAYATSRDYGISWPIPATEISFYIVCKYFGWRIALMNNPHAALKKINYDIKTASKAEIVMSFIGVFVFSSLVLGPLFVVIAEKFIDPYAGQIIQQSSIYEQPTIAEDFQRLAELEGREIAAIYIAKPKINIEDMVF